MADKVQKIRKTVENRYEYWKEKESNSHSIESEIRMSECKHLLLMLDSLQEEPVSEDLEEAADNCYFHNHAYARESFIEGAKWQKQQMIDKAIDWLKSNIGYGEWIMEFRKHLED